MGEGQMIDGEMGFGSLLMHSDGVDNFCTFFLLLCYIEVARRWSMDVECGERASGNSGDVNETKAQQCFWDAVPIA
jgi:hypothetical protein